MSSSEDTSGSATGSRAATPALEFEVTRELIHNLTTGESVPGVRVRWRRGGKWSKWVNTPGPGNEITDEDLPRIGHAVAEFLEAQANGG